MAVKIILESLYRSCITEHAVPIASIFGAGYLEVLPNLASHLPINQATAAFRCGGFVSFLCLSTLPGGSTKRRGEGSGGVPEAVASVA